MFRTGLGVQEQDMHTPDHVNPPNSHNAPRLIYKSEPGYEASCLYVVSITEQSYVFIIGYKSCIYSVPIIIFMNYNIFLNIPI